MKFDGVKCDECGRVKGDVNHWITIQAVMDTSGNCVGLVVGPIGENVITAGEFSGCKLEPRDLCGQDCNLKYITKLLHAGPAADPEAAHDEN